METAPSEGALETTGMAVRVIEFEIVHFRHKNLLLFVTLINGPEFPLRNVNDARYLSLAQSFH